MHFQSHTLPQKTGKPNRWLTVIDRGELEEWLGGPVTDQVLVQFDIRGQTFTPSHGDKRSRAILCVAGSTVVCIKDPEREAEDKVKIDAGQNSVFNSLIVVPAGLEVTIKNDPETTPHARVMMWLTGEFSGEQAISSGAPAPEAFWFKQDEIVEMLGSPVATEYINNMLPGANAGHHFHKSKHEVMIGADGTLVLGAMYNCPFIGTRHDTLTYQPLLTSLTVFVEPRWAHAVWNKGDRIARVWIWATAEPRLENDDFVCMVPAP